MGRRVCKNPNCGATGIEVDTFGFCSKKCRETIHPPSGPALMRDSFYRSFCAYEKDYDNVIECVKKNNPHCPKDPLEAEKFAVDAVHSCIRTVVYTDSIHCSTGGCLAVLHSRFESTRKVILAYRP